MTQTLIEKPLMPEHPVLPFNQEMAAGILAQHGEKKLAEYVAQRNAAIHAELTDPLNYGFELPTWLLADVLAGFIDKATFRRKIAEIRALAWRPEVYDGLGRWLESESLERAIDEGPYQLVMVVGGNAGGKTEWMLKRVVQHADKFEEYEGWVLHETNPMSITYHQTRTWKYLPENWRTTGKGQVGYVSYKKQTGFPDGKATGPKGGLIWHRNYEQKEDSFEGGELGDKLERRAIGFAADELIPLPLLKTLRLRLNRRQAAGVLGFTPKHGYSDVVAWFRDGATVVLEEMAIELREPRMLPLVEIGAPEGEPAKPRKAVVYFPTIYNPYPTRNSYQNLVDLLSGDSDATRAIRIRGYAKKQEMNLFPRLDERVHVFESVIGENV
ncbi:MAG: hypothetical protein AAGJ81_10660 [Verrucomicrobiota bacterium]